MRRPTIPVEKYVRHPLEAFGVMIVWGFFRLLPYTVASAIGGWLGRTLGPHLKISDRARRNIRLAMPETADADVERIVIGMWDNLGRVAAEFPHIAGIAFDGSDPRIRFVGEENLFALRDDGVAGMLFGGHIANWEVSCLAAQSCGMPSLFIYREANNPLVEKLFLWSRRGTEGNMAPKGGEGAKNIIGALVKKKHVGLLVDQKMNDGIAVPFFGHDAMTAPALGQMALKYKCPVVPMRVVRERGSFFRIDVLAPIYAEDTGDRHADIARFMARVNTHLEGWIREHPEQWLWLHNRWPDKS